MPAVHTAVAARYPEGPVLADGGVLFVEFSRDRVMLWREGTVTRVWHSPGCGPAGLAGDDHSLWVACHARHQLVRLTRAEPPRVLRTWDIPFPNDMVLDAHGGVYVTASGVFDADARVSGEVYYIDPDGEVTRMATGLRYSNGVALSHAGTRLHVSEHLQNRVRAYDVGAEGRLADAGITTDLEALPAHPQSADATLLGPDGLAMDADGHMWVAHYAGGRLVRVDDAGHVQASVSFGAPYVNVTNVAAHADGRVFVTVTSDDAEAGHPGAVVALRPGAFASDHVLCTVTLPHVTCAPR